MNFLENVALAPLTTLGVGGPARFFTEAESEDDVREAIGFAEERDLPLFVLGGGSNLVVADAGFDGLVLKIAIRGVESWHQQEKRIFAAGAGEAWDSLVASAVEQDCAGLECLSGIPGSVGGTPVQNVGGYGQDVSKTIVEVVALDQHSCDVGTFTNEQCGFGYRTSIFNTSERGRWIILRVTYALSPNGEPLIEYADLKRYFKEWNANPTLRETREAVREIRRSKAMLLVDGDEDARSAGSFFKNPVISSADYERLASGFQAPKYPAIDGHVKVPAAWLVEHAGFAKGLSRGNVGISRKHALAIVNRGGAMAADVIGLKNEIQDAVEAKFGIRLQPEPVFVGFES
jgi:UDP-N-acetylmuramate dehydrogenase